MNLLLSKRGDYVVRSALSLARAYNEGSLRKIREVVADVGVPQTYASQILSDLVNSGIAESKAGKEGGYKLTREPKKITLLEIVQAAEGPLVTQQCSLGDGPCRWDAVCPLHEIWSSATAALRNVLAKYSLEDLLNKDLELEQQKTTAPPDSHRKVAKAILLNDWIHIERNSEFVTKFLTNQNLISKLLSASLTEIEALAKNLDSLAPSWSAAKVDVLIVPATKASLNNASKKENFKKTTLPPLKLNAEILTTQSLPIHIEAKITLKDLGSDRCEVKLTGSLRPPPERESSSNKETSTKLVNTLSRVFLRRLAFGIENP